MEVDKSKTYKEWDAMSIKDVLDDYHEKQVKYFTELKKKYPRNTPVTYYLNWKRNVGK